jgi:hypothetical protein
VKATNAMARFDADVSERIPSPARLPLTRTPGSLVTFLDEEVPVRFSLLNALVTRYSVLLTTRLGFPPFVALLAS